MTAGEFLGFGLIGFQNGYYGSLSIGTFESKTINWIRSEGGLGYLRFSSPLTIPISFIKIDGINFALTDAEPWSDYKFNKTFTNGQSYEIEFIR